MSRSLLPICLDETHLNYLRPLLGDRDDQVVPAAYLENSDDPVELKEAARTALDMLWQGFGFWSCPLYDQQGEYKR